MAKRTTMSLSIQTKERMNALRTQLEKDLAIHHVKLTDDDIVKILLTVKQLDEILVDLCVGGEILDEKKA